MNAFDQILSKVNDDTTSMIFENIDRTVETIELNYSKGETDITTLLFTKKDGLTFAEAIPLLVMRFKMYCEEWNDLTTYTKADIELWTSFIKDEYEQSTFIMDASIDEFKENYFVHRIFENDKQCKIASNRIELDFENFQKLNPLKDEIINVAKITFNRLETIFFVETKLHYIFFNWYTTA